MKILEILLLIIPVTLWALWNDRNGDDHKNLNDVFWEVKIMVSACNIVRVMQWEHPVSDYDYVIGIVKNLLVSITGFGLLFPYLFNWMWFNKNYNGTDLENGNRIPYILTHLSETAIPDKWFIKYDVHWMVRLLLYVTLFVLSLIWFW